MKRVIFIWLAILFFGALTAFGQSNTNTSNYFVNPYILNPAFAGKTSTQALFFDIRKDLSGVENGPSSQYITYDWGAVPDKIGIGIMFKNESAGFVQNHQGYLSFSYRATLSKDHYVDFGINGGVAYRGIDFDKLVAKHAGESILHANNKYESVFDAGLGMRYYLHGIEAGLAVNHLTSPEFSYANNTDQSVLNSPLHRNYLLTVAYNFKLQNDFEIKPLVVLNSAHGVPPTYQGGVAAFWKKSLWLGALYKHDLGVNVSAGFQAYSRLSLAYSYHYYTGELNRISQGGHEIILGLKFAKEKAKTNKEDKKIKEIEKQNGQMFEDMQVLQEQNRRRKEEIESLQKRLSEKEKDSLRSEVQGIQKIKKHDEENADSLAAEKQKLATPLAEIPAEEETIENEVKEVDDVETGEYKVILGAFKDMDHATSMQKILKREYEINTSIAKNRLSKNYPFLIYSKGCDTREECAQELKKMQSIDKKGVITGEPWLYKSH